MCDVYKIIPDSANIITTLVDSIVKDETYQKHINKLAMSENIQDKKKVEMINETIKKIKVFNTKINPLFLAKDIGVLMGISQINYLIRKFESEERVVGYINKNNKTKKVLFLTKHGIYRCFFASRSPLARVFRKFICTLMDHMIEHETEIIEKISNKFQVENKQLIKNGIIDLNKRMFELEKKYLDELEKSKKLEECVNKEFEKNQLIEQENIEYEIANSYNIMYIEQLKKEKEACIKHARNIRENIVSDMDTDMIELKLLKEKYMKPLYIYIPHPNYFKKLISKKMNDVENKDMEQYKNIILDKTYEYNFNNIFSKDEINIDSDELLYFILNFGRNISKKDKVILIDTNWVVNKTHFINVCNSLALNSNTLVLSKIYLYKTSLDEIRDIIREEFLSIF